ncbi:MAG: glycosyltransferase family 39 protein [Tannerella sp.]|jgi:4-amino-4-deoxy-L-arabinose transferase-like glycosyltransferase|nr:glycosyltransferase family 39 protein [Tannerella sp.]
MRTSALQYLYLQKPVSSVIIICAIALLPCLGNNFYTKGEALEASVAALMLESGNWILPKTASGEFTGKPPVAPWLMTLFSLPQGHVSKFTSRLPSAIAQIVLIGFVLAFFGKRTRFQEAFIATLLLITCPEIRRAGMTAYADMLFATFVVLGLMQLYRWENKLDLKGLPVIIPVLFSCAILTEGFTGVVVPLLVFFVYLLILRKYSLPKIIKALLYAGISSMFIPVIWYAAAYKQGGYVFPDIILTGDFGRLFDLNPGDTGNAPGYVKSVLYNFGALLCGFIPWTVLFIFSLFGAKWRMPGKSFRQIMNDARNWFLSIEKVKRFSIVAAVCIIFFHTVLPGERSMYILSAYPFISILLARYFIYITENRSKVTRIFAFVLTTTASIAFVAGILMMTHAVDFNAIIAGYTTNASILRPVESITGTFASGHVINRIIMAFLLTSIITVIYQTTKRINIKILYATILMTFCLNLFIDGIVMKGFGYDSFPVEQTGHHLKTEKYCSPTNLIPELPGPPADASMIISPV